MRSSRAELLPRPHAPGLRPRRRDPDLLGDPKTWTFAQLLIDCEEVTLRAVLGWDAAGRLIALARDQSLGAAPTANWQSVRMTMTEADVLEVLQRLGEGEIAVWLMGGWGVDALVGEQTREHEDLDLIVRDDEVSRMSDLLYPHGFLLSRGAQGGFNLRDERDHLVDVHPVRFDNRGNGHFEQDRGSFKYPAAAFAAVGTIAGRRLACLSAEGQMTDHSFGYEPGDTDVHDMRLLHDRLGTPLMGPYQSV